MEYILITLGYVGILLLIVYNGLKNGSRVKPKPKIPRYSFLSGENPLAALPVVDPPPIAPAHLARQKLRWVGGMICAIAGLLVLVSIPIVAKISALIAGMGIGFLFALLQYNHWDDVMKEENRPKLDKWPPKSYLLYATTLIGFHVYGAYVRGIIDNSDLHFPLMLGSFLIATCVCLGFLVEHLLLYLLHRQNTSLLNGDPS